MQRRTIESPGAVQIVEIEILFGLSLCLSVSLLLSSS